LSDSLLTYVLRRLEQFPKSVFWETDLRCRAAPEFGQLLSSQLLHLVREDPERLVWPCPSGSFCEGEGREIRSINDQLWAICTCPAEEPPLRVNREDLHRYAFNLDGYVERLRAANGLGGRPSPLDQHFTFLGDAAFGDHTAAWVLAFLRNSAESIRLLESLRGRLPGIHGKVVVLTASFQPPPEDAVRLEGLGTCVVSCLGGDDLKVSLSPRFLAALAASSTVPEREAGAIADPVQLSVTEAAKYIGVTDRTIREWRRNGKLVAVEDANGQLLFSKSTLEILRAARQ